MEWREVRKISLEFTGKDGPQTRPNTPHLIFKHPLVQNSTTDTKKSKIGIYRNGRFLSWQLDTILQLYAWAIDVAPN